MNSEKSVRERSLGMAQKLHTFMGIVIQDAKAGTLTPDDLVIRFTAMQNTLVDLAANLKFSLEEELRRINEDNDPPTEF